MKNSEPELTRIRVDLPNHWWHKEELLWARPLGSDTYEIAKMPFCAYGLNCGDVVLATPDAPELIRRCARSCAGAEIGPCG